MSFELRKCVATLNMNGAFPLIISCCSVNVMTPYNWPANVTLIICSGKTLLVFQASLGMDEFVRSIALSIDINKPQSSSSRCPPFCDCFPFWVESENRICAQDSMVIPRFCIVTGNILKMKLIAGRMFIFTIFTWPQRDMERLDQWSIFPFILLKVWVRFLYPHLIYSMLDVIFMWKNLLNPTINI